MLASDDAPSLHGLHLQSPTLTAGSITTPTPLFHGQASNLRTLTVKITFPSLGILPPSLLSVPLTLEDLVWPTSTFSRFTAFIQCRFRDLEILVIRNVARRSALHSPHVATLEFPKLHTSLLAGADENFVGFVVGSNRFPACQVLKVGVTFGTTESGSLFPPDCLASASPAPKFAASKFPDMGAELEVSHYAIHYMAGSGERYHLSVRMYADLDRTGWIVELLDRVTSVVSSLPLSVTSRGSSCRGPVFNSVLGLDGTASLSLDTKDKYIHSVLHKLGQPILVDGFGRFPFSCLEVLGLKCANILVRDVLGTLTNRQSYNMQESQIEYPRGLKTLYVPWDEELCVEAVQIREI
ncbi:hypothetical protein FRB99_008628 [Tulasnella sp. 403]|nr:hypothetical protein FRB99_008628 [Tulasnella sp. 403]